jgi:hypothetical protein
MYSYADRAHYYANEDQSKHARIYTHDLPGGWIGRWTTVKFSDGSTKEFKDTPDAWKLALDAVKEYLK